MLSVDKELLYQRLSRVVPEVRIYDTTGSTSTDAKEYAANACGRDAVFIALQQTAGRGQHGRSFVSDLGVGLYMSYLTHRAIPADRIAYLTAYAAVAVTDAIKEFTAAEAGIKWVNDVYIGGKKVAGILSEGAFSPSLDALEYAIVGIGLNLYKRDFGDLSDIATDLESATGVTVDFTQIAEYILRALTDMELGEEERIAEAYAGRSIMQDKRIFVREGGREYFAKALGIGRDLSLRVLTDAEEEIELSSADVAIRM